MKTDEDLTKRFIYCDLSSADFELIQELRKHALFLANMYQVNCPESSELSFALTKIKESIMWAATAIEQNRGLKENDKEKTTDFKRD